MVDAAIAALLEAVQSRMTDISGARDDIIEADYALTAPLPNLNAGNCIALVPATHCLTTQQRISFLLDRHSRAGMSEPLIFDLHDKDNDFYCVAIHCPGLETGTAQAGYRTGHRAQRRIIMHLGIP